MRLCLEREELTDLDGAPLTLARSDERTVRTQIRSKRRRRRVQLPFMRLMPI